MQTRKRGAKRRRGSVGRTRETTCGTAMLRQRAQDGLIRGESSRNIQAGKPFRRGGRHIRRGGQAFSRSGRSRVESTRPVPFIGRARIFTASPAIRAFGRYHFHLRTTVTNRYRWTIPHQLPRNSHSRDWLKKSRPTGCSSPCFQTRRRRRGSRGSRGHCVKNTDCMDNRCARIACTSRCTTSGITPAFHRMLSPRQGRPPHAWRSQCSKSCSTAFPVFPAGRATILSCCVATRAWRRSSPCRPSLEST